MVKENKIIVTFNGIPKVEIKGTTQKEYLVEFINPEENKVIYSSTIKTGMWTQCSQRWNVPWVIKVNGKIVHTHNLEGKTVKISLESKSVGDTLAWTPQAVEFAKFYKCKVVLSTFHNEWFEGLPEYKNIKFVKPGTLGEYYAVYNIGWFKTNEVWDEGKYHPIRPNTIPLIKCATDILGLPYKEINHGINFKPHKKPIKGKYICIGPHSTAGLKQWPFEYWEELAQMLNNKGYKIVDISYEDHNKKNIINAPKLNWNDTFNHLYHAEYFIGLGSGLSWFNWAMGKPTLMVNNFLPYGYEFTKGLTKVENYSVCNNCWVDERIMFNRGKWDWCPRHQDTLSQHICHKSIKPQKVFKILSNLLKFK